MSSTVNAACLNGLSPLWQQGRDYFSRQQYLLATQQFSMFSLLNCSKNLQDKGRVRWAQSLYELDEYTEAERVIEKISPRSPYAHKAKVLEAWYEPSFVPTLPKLDQKRFDDFHRQLNSIPVPKKPWIAASLSAILPGAGQVYNGTYQSAIFAFVLNSLFLSTTIDFERKNMNAAAITSGVLFSVVYFGNILGAAHISERINNLYLQPRKRALEQRLFPELQPQ